MSRRAISLLISRSIDLHGRCIGVDLYAFSINNDAMTTFGFGDSVSCGAKVEDL